MNLHDDEFDPSLQELEAKLSQWKVAPPSIDPKVVFYQAGFAAASAQNQTRLWNQRLMTAASLLIAIGFSCIISYRAGQSSVLGDGQMIAAEAPHNQETSSQEPSVAPERHSDKDIGQFALEDSSRDASKADSSTLAPSWGVILANQWSQNIFTVKNSHDRELLAAVDSDRALQAMSERHNGNAPVSRHADLTELVDSPEFAMLKRQRAIRAQQLGNWLPTL